MSITTHSGSPQFPNIAGDIPASTQEEMNKAIEELRLQKDAWVRRSIQARVAIIDQVINDFSAVAKRWVDACQQAKGISGDAPFGGEEWASGPWPVLKNLRQLRQSLIDIETHGRPRIPGKVTTTANGQVVAGVFPQNAYDRIFFTGITAELWMEPGVTAEALPETQALIYRDKEHDGKVALVLAAGNVSSIGPLDILYKLFIEDQVTLLKMNPVNAYLGPLIEKSFRVLIDPGFLRITYGGAAEGAYLCQHAGIDEIHITGSDKTFDAIVFGTGTEGVARKAQGKPALSKRITGELGNVSPIIIVPGPWTARDIAYQATQIATTLTLNAGFNCNATRVLVQHSGWQQREELLQAIRGVLQDVPTRAAYYPGARERQSSFVAEHPEAEYFGNAQDGQLPWTLIAGVQAGNAQDICFTTEVFCGLFAETALDATSIAEYIDRAVTFTNEELWGTLNATIIVHPASLKQPGATAAMERAVANLRYGTIGVNYWAGSGFTLGTTTWGAFPGHPFNDIQSGVGVVHNTLMFAHPQKTVLRGPFRSTPTPPWFVTQGKVTNQVFSRLVSFERSPSPLKVLGIMRAALG
jgi:acyl-CoA reductase-like NAD-dependent aldehyde dehydrogenase